MKWPEHKSGFLPNVKFDKNKQHRTVCSYNAEDDCEQSIKNQPLTNGLRDGSKSVPRDDVVNDVGPPAWYNEDVQNYASKFDKVVRERKDFKQRYMADRDFSILTQNANA